MHDPAYIRTFNLPAREPFDTARPWDRAKAPFIYICSKHDADNIFGWYLDKLDSIDFANTHVLGRYLCMQCAVSCNEDNTPCHRNRCNKGWVWVLRSNKTFTEIDFSKIPGHGKAKEDGLASYVPDTVVKAKPDSQLFRWYIYSFGDCHARFSYKILEDSWYHNLLLREWNIYGGCRGGNSWHYTFQFTHQRPFKYYFRSETLVDRE
jgi:hypothetical protein